ncbi:protein bark beetle-like [Dendronephthya gigantea]|uniref:protein bark beetle-like n=1 Tax=Dendronephthya gigantea TaxID=151771 RepID=UPI00106A739C|nr:protein bark beetle-like [Dendronephthya gigantea]
MDWQSSAVVVEIHFKGAAYAKKELKIFLSSRIKTMKDNKILVISDVTIHRFKGAAITFNANQDTAIIKNSVITDSSANCISVSGKTYVLKVVNNTFQRNGNYSLKTSMLVLSAKHYSLFIVERNIFRSNNYAKIITTVVSIQTVRYVSQIDNNDFLYNSCENLVDIEYGGYSCPVKDFTIVSIFSKNRWINNHMRSASAVALKSNNYWLCFPYKLDVAIKENEFLNNRGKSIIEIHSRWLTTLALNSNHFQGNVLEKNAVTLSLEYYAYGNKLSLLHNKVFDNVAELLFDILSKDLVFVDIRGNTIMRNEVERSILNLADLSSYFKFTRNILIANVLHRRAVLPYYDINYSAALICSGRLISANENFFENPQFPFEIILTPIDNTYEIDGRYNWWGTNNGSEVIARIFDFRHRNYLPRLNFSPFLASANLSDVINEEIRNIFRNDSVLGGLLTENIVLNRDQSPYTVTRDVIIHPNASLTIEKGVQVNVRPYLGFIVYGKLDILGERSNPIKFDIATKLKEVSNFGHYSIRLVNGSKPWEGIVEILYNNTWGAICDDGSSYSNRIVLCKQLGFKGYTRTYRYPISNNTGLVWWKNLKCNHRTHDDISSCPFQGWGVSCNNRLLWAVQCHPGYWRGIRFRETAKPSKITHVKFERGGDLVHKYLSSYMLNFDVLRQVIRNIEIHDSVKGGIRIAFQVPGLDMRNILIDEQYGRKHNSFGIETSSSLICYNCSVIAKEWGIYFRETGMESFIDDVGVKRIDSLVVPDILLRRKYSLCEQNKSIIVSKDDMKIILGPKTLSEASFECSLNLTLLSQATMVAEIILSSNETFTITATSSSTSSNIHIAASQNDTYSLGPGNITLRYWRKAHSHGARIRLVIFSTKGEGECAMKKVVGEAVLSDGSVINNNYGIRLDRNSIVEFLKIQNVTLKIFYYGIYLYYSSSNVSINNCVISDGSYVINSHYSSQGVFLKDSELSDCSHVVNLVHETDLKFVEMENCVVRRMSAYVITSYYKNLQQTQVIILRRCIFIENQRILYTFRALYSHIEVTECNISGTKFYGFEIDSYQPENDFALAINNNTFSENLHYLFLIRKHNVDTSRSSILFKNNVFVNNSMPSGHGIIYLFGKGIRTAMTHIKQNTFLENECSFIINVDAKSNWMPQTFSVRGNIIEHNKGVPLVTPTYTIPAVYSYSIGLFGCAFSNYDVRANVFNNKLMGKELFIGRTCGSNYIPENDYIDGTFNYWGTSSAEELWEKIFHFDNWNDRPKVLYLPASATRNFTSTITSKPYANQSQIGGYINTSLLLTTINSPYVVTSDLTISKNTTLYIEPGVQLYFKPNIGLLILGNIVANGTTNEKIKFCSSENRCKNRQRKVRLVSEDREYAGKLEIFVDAIWQAVCPDYFTSKDGIVACRQLGYGRYINHQRRYYGVYTSPRYRVSLKCRGNETSFSNCKHQIIGQCSSYYMLFMQCESNFKWGSIRIIHPNVVNSTGHKDKEQKELSSLKNIFIHDAGILHDYSVPSIQVIARSPFLAHINISGSNGIEIIGQKDTMEIQHVTVESSSNYPAISMLGNQGSVSISEVSIKGRKQHGIAIAPLKNMTLLQPFLGQHDLCGPVQKVYVHDRSYAFLNQRNKMKAIVCRMAFESSVSDNRKIHFRLLSWTKSSYSVTIYNSDRSTKFASIHSGNTNLYLDKYIVIPTDSFVIEADISTLNRFMAEITVTGKTGKGSSNVIVGESSFQETSGAALHYTSDHALPIRLKIRRSHVALVGNDGKPIKPPSIEMVVSNNDSIEISNNVFTASNRGGIHIYLFGKKGMVNIVNNIISGIKKGSEAIHVAVVGGDAQSKLFMAGNFLNVNDIIYPHDLVNIKNVDEATITDNVCYDNAARNTLNLVASSKTNNMSFITRNVFFLNKGRSHTMQIQSYGREVIKQNYFSNPSNQFELRTLSSGFSDTIVNASYNWWGNANRAVIMRKIMDRRMSTQLPHVIYQPFLQSPTPIFATGLCSFGWIFLNAKCYYNLRSAQNFQKSKEMCKKIGGSMFSSQDFLVASMVLKKLHHKLAYGTKISIWIDVVTKQGRGCWVFDGAMRETSCDLARPTICERKPSGLCTNDCSSNGICLGQTCKCNSGWEGADCSSYHCKDLGNCSSYGNCVGPNHCKCRLGWMGRGCTVSYCPPFKTCRSCHSRKGCGC